MSNLKKINIVGCGYMGSQISCLFSILGYEVNIWNRHPINIEQLKKKKKIICKTSGLEDRDGIIKFEKNLTALKDNITIECLAEDIELKKKYISEIKKNISKDLFSNTSSIKLTDISKELNLLHFFNPISLGIIEIKLNKDISSEAKILINDLEKINFEILSVNNNTGYALNKLIFSEISNFFYLIEEEKINKNQLSKVFLKLKNFNLLGIIDLIGVDTTINIFNNLKKVYDYYYIPKFLKICEDQKILGKKNKTTVKKIFDMDIYP